MHIPATLRIKNRLARVCRKKCARRVEGGEEEAGAEMGIENTAAGGWDTLVDSLAGRRKHWSVKQ